MTFTPMAHIRSFKAGPGLALATIAVSTLLSMSAWFSASFVIPDLTTRWGLERTSASWLTISVQLGFVIGAVASGLLGIADRVGARLLFLIGSVGAATANFMILFAGGLESAVVWRGLTGLFLAFVYPSAIKETSTWFTVRRGTALGVMIGALTLGSAMPHAIRAVVEVNWEFVIVGTSLITLLGGLLIVVLGRDGPHPFPRHRVSFGGAVRSLKSREVLLADLGYVGHMWELYAMWAMIGSLLAGLPVVAHSDNPTALGSALAFTCIGVGAVGCLVGGVLSDRYGRAWAARTSMTLSAASAMCIALGLDFLPDSVIIALCLAWGFWVIADSAQFSALVSEYAAPESVGSALSLQLAVGYLMTALTIWLIPYLVIQFSWRMALTVLAIGPLLGAWAMSKLIATRRRSFWIVD